MTDFWIDTWACGAWFVFGALCYHNWLNDEDPLSTIHVFLITLFWPLCFVVFTYTAFKWRKEHPVDDPEEHDL